MKNDMVYARRGDIEKHALLKMITRCYVEQVV